MNVFVERSREYMREHGVELNGTVIENMVRTYACHIVDMEIWEEEYIGELEESTDWNYDCGYKEAMERWLTVCGVFPQSPYVQSFIDEERENRKED